MNGLKVWFLVGFFGYASLITAQTSNPLDSIKNYSLSEFVITGTRTERSVASLPVPVQVITAESIQKSGVSRLNEIIQEQTGLITVPSFGGGEGIQIQGLDAAYVMILIDGQPLVGRSAGTLDLSRITVNNIERIEIIKGASSSLYGSEALAGVVNIITKKLSTDGDWKLNLNYRLATFNTNDATASIRYGKNKVAFELFSNYFSAQGYDLGGNNLFQTVEPFYNYTVQPKLKIQLSEQIDLVANIRYYTQNQENRAVINGGNYEGESIIEEWNNSIFINQKINDQLKIVYDLYATNYRTDEYLNDALEDLFEESFYDQWFFRPEVRVHWRKGLNLLTTGIGMNYETMERTYFTERAHLNSEYLFAQYEWFIKEKWNILAGFRYDHHHQYKSQFSPKLGVNYKYNSYLAIKASAGYGYKAPDLRQLYFDFTNSSFGYTVAGYNVAPNRLALLESQGQILFSNNLDYSTPLKPESSINTNIGAFYQKDKWSFDANFFYNQIKNLIDTRAIAQRTNGQSVFSYFNLDQIFTYGIELNTTYQIHKNLTLHAGYQYLVPKDQNTIKQLAEGALFARNPITLSSFRLNTSDYFGLFNRSKHMANLKINYNLSKYNTNINARLFYRSKYGVFDTNSNNILDDYDVFVKGYCLLNLSATKEFKHGFSLQMGTLNLLNYKDIDNIPNLAGRQIFSKIQYSF